MIHKDSILVNILSPITKEVKKRPKLKLSLFEFNRMTYPNNKDTDLVCHMTVIGMIDENTGLPSQGMLDGGILSIDSKQAFNDKFYAPDGHRIMVENRDLLFWMLVATDFMP